MRREAYGSVFVCACIDNWGEPKRAPHLRDDGLSAYAQSVVMYIDIDIIDLSAPYHKGY